MKGKCGLIQYLRKEDIFLKGLTPRRQSKGKHGVKGSEKMEPGVGKLCEGTFRMLVQRDGRA